MFFAFFLPLTAGLVYSMAALTLKQATTPSGIGLTRVLFISNLMFVVVFSPLLLIDHEVLDWSRWPGLLEAGVAVFLGSIFRIMAIRAMHVSFLTPLMGSKALFAAILSVILIGMPIPFSWWLGAAITTVAVFILGFSSGFKGHLAIKGVFYALLCSFLFASSEVTMAKEAHLFGKTPFIVFMVMIQATLSFLLIPFFKRPLTMLPKGSWKYTITGGALLGVQAMLLFTGISQSGNAVLANIAYASRGFWSILLVWFLGHWWANDERAHGAKTMIRRTIGASLLFIAIVIVLVF